MSYKTLLVHVANDKRCAARIVLALQLAGRFEARLTGLYVRHIPEIPVFPYEGGAEPVLNLLLEAEEARSAKAAETFRGRIQGAASVTTEWRSAEGQVEDALSLYGRYADLVIVGQPDPEETYPAVPADFPAALALAMGRPVLVVPYAGTFTDVGAQVLVAWNGSREATRAVADALPLLERAEKVHIAAVNPPGGAGGQGEVAGADLAVYLASHGVNAEIMPEAGVEIDTGEWLLSQAADVSADLIVMGAYGHRRVREWVLGGVTRTLAREMTVPVLMSH